MELTKEDIREIVDYDPDTGLMTWRERVGPLLASQRNLASWNKRFAGKEAGSLSSEGYVALSISAFGDSVRVYAHRVAFLYMVGYIPSEVDHINGVRTDNRWRNLRQVARRQNTRNKKIGSTNSSGVLGVSWDTRCKAWQCSIRSMSGKSLFLGRHKDFFEAVCARKSAEVRHRYHQNHGRVT